MRSVVDANIMIVHVVNSLRRKKMIAVIVKMIMMMLVDQNQVEEVFRHQLIQSSTNVLTPLLL